MAIDHRAKLATIKRFDQLLAYLRDEMDWPIERIEIDDLMFEYTPEELGIDTKSAAKIEEIKRLRPLSTRQPWGIFFIKFEPKRLPVVALRRILSQVVLKKRATGKAAGQVAWAADDLLFVSNYGEGDERHISFAHFSQPEVRNDLPTLKVLGWDNLDTPLRLDAVAKELTTHLSWPEDENNTDAWRKNWGSAFTLRHREVITTARELSIQLAKLARAIRDRIKTALAIETERGPLTKLLKAFQEALVHDLDAEGFADMYAQTITYGLLSARITDPKSKTADDLSAHMRTNPFLRELMTTFVQVGGRRGKAGGKGIDFDELGVNEVVELLDDANMEAVILDFGDKNPQEDPVIHFYELFLKEYDAKKRMQRGVFYTPRPVVSYIVRSVDELLRTEFGLEDGLADTTTWGEMTKRYKDLTIPKGASSGQAFVQILDPATGTGTFLVEVIDLIHRKLVEKWKAQGHSEKRIAALWNEYVPKYLLPRLHGYELLMAPYAIAHLKIGLKLYETGYRFGSDERARIYLTNTLEPASDSKKQTEFKEWLPALAEEAQAVNEIKRNQRFTVVIGNPPYAGISLNMSEQAQRLVDAYKIVDGASLNERKVWLQDDYVKFIRMSQITIEQAHVGILGFITNHGYIDNPTFRGMRQSLLKTFQQCHVLDLHGNANKKEQLPDGSEDKNVFDIRQGVAIGIATRSGTEATIGHADLWGARDSKYAWLAKNDICSTDFSTLQPDSPYYFFEPQNTRYRAEYERGWKLADMFTVMGVGIVTARDGLTIDRCEAHLWDRVQRFGSLRTEEARSEYALGKDVQSWKVHWAQEDVKQSGPDRSLIRKIQYRPFDPRYIYYTGVSSGFVCRPVRDVMKHMLQHQNIGLVVCRQSGADGWRHVLAARGLVESCYVSNRTREIGYVIPLTLVADETGLLGPDGERRVNLSTSCTTILSEHLIAETPQSSREQSKPAANEMVQYVYSILHSPTYRTRYAEFLMIDFPRIPIPGSMKLFHVLSSLGGELVALHLLESPKLNNFITTYSGPKNPEVTRVGWSEDTVWLDAAATKKGQPATPGTNGFRGVPEAVWKFHIGGYQVCEKWLKDRKGRTLSKDDMEHYQKIVVALSETIRIMGEIDRVIDEHGGWPIK